jgi:alkanesulfonate monooxygenase SsuD/methylene tetrahydromethanopterin reductase-like flavin-dependent oxidoreductase (luciferase family)
VVAANTNAEAQHLASSVYAFFLNVIRGTSGQLQPPVEIDSIWNEQEEMAVQQMLRYQFVGDQATVATQLNRFIQQTQVDEVMVVSNIYDHEARLQSYELLAGVKELQVV